MRLEMKKTIKRLINNIEKFRLFKTYEDLLIQHLDDLFKSCTSERRTLTYADLLLGAVVGSSTSPENLEITKDFLEELVKVKILKSNSDQNLHIYYSGVYYTPDCFKRVSYHDYKTNYSNCIATKDSYDKQKQLKF